MTMKDRKNRIADIYRLGWQIQRGEGMMKPVVAKEVRWMMGLLSDAGLTASDFELVIERGKRPTVKKLRKDKLGKDGDYLLPMGEK